jgi:ribosomal-protein-serine acetyltransferase
VSERGQSGVPGADGRELPVRSIRVDENVRLRDPSTADAEELFALVDANRSYLARWLPWPEQIRTVNDEREWIRSRRAPGAADSELALLIVEDGIIAGGLGIAGLGSVHRAVEVGYWLAARAQGRGLVTRSCRAALKYLFESRAVNRVQIRAAVDNARSRAVPERLGFTLEGIQRQAVLLNGSFQDLAVYSMLASEWNNRHP